MQQQNLPFSGIVQSSFWIHVSQTREGFNPPLRPSLRRGSNSNQTSDIGSTCLTGNPFGVSSVWRNELPSLVWLTLDPCLSDGLSGGLNPPFVWLTWIQKLIVLYLHFLTLQSELSQWIWQSSIDLKFEHRSDTIRLIEAMNFLFWWVTLFLGILTGYDNLFKFNTIWWFTDAIFCSVLSFESEMQLVLYTSKSHSKKSIILPPADVRCLTSYYRSLHSP